MPINLPVIAVTGFNREGLLLRQSGVTVIAGGGDADQLAAKLAAIGKDCSGIISFGMAGGLDPALRLGDWVIGSQVSGGWSGDCDADWAAELHRRIAGSRLAPIYADGRLISDPQEKASIGQSHGAVAVDMESHIAAQAAAKAGVPFAVMRCISDAQSTPVPEAITLSMQPDGGIAMGSVLRSIVRKTSQLPELMGITLGFYQVYRSLRSGVGAAGVNLAFS